MFETLIEGFEARPGLTEWHEWTATDPDRLAVLLVAQAVGVRDRGRFLDVAEQRRHALPRVADHDDGRWRHVGRRPVIVRKVCRHGGRQTAPVEIERAGLAVVA